MSEIWISMREKKLTDTLTLMTDTLARVTAERDALKENYDSACEILDMMVGGAVNMLDIARDADRLAAEMDALKADAERYRFIHTRPEWLGWDQDFNHRDIDAIVDRAMKGKS